MANVKIPGLPLTDSVKNTDLFEKVNTPETTPVSQRCTAQQLFDYTAVKIGYIPADNRFTQKYFGDAVDAQFSGRVNILIGPSQAGLQIKQSSEDSFSFFEFFDPSGAQLATLNESGNLNVANDVGVGGQLSVTGAVSSTAGYIANGQTGFTGTFLVLTALPSTFKTVTVVGGIITNVA